MRLDTLLRVPSTGILGGKTRMPPLELIFRTSCRMIGALLPAAVATLVVILAQSSQYQQKHRPGKLADRSAVVGVLRATRTF